MRKRIAWNGDRNFYEGFNVFWRMGGPGGAETAVQMTLADWQGFWAAREVRPGADQVIWRQSATNRPASSHLPADYALGDGENPAHNAATDGRDAGALDRSIARRQGIVQGGTRSKDVNIAGNCDGQRRTIKLSFLAPRSLLRRLLIVGMAVASSATSLCCSEVLAGYTHYFTWMKKPSAAQIDACVKDMAAHRRCGARTTRRAGRGRKSTD